MIDVVMMEEITVWGEHKTGSAEEVNALAFCS